MKYYINIKPETEYTDLRVAKREAKELFESFSSTSEAVPVVVTDEKGAVRASFEPLCEVDLEKETVGDTIDNGTAEQAEIVDDIIDDGVVETADEAEIPTTNNTPNGDVKSFRYRIVLRDKKTGAVSYWGNETNTGIKYYKSSYEASKDVPHIQECFTNKIIIIEKYFG